MMQEIIVAFIVAYAAWVLLRRYAPAAIRELLRTHIHKLAQARGWGWLADTDSSLQKPVASDESGCSNCSGCSSKSRSQPVQQPLVRMPLKQHGK